jgi:dihydroflavonol-4-reductase
MGGRHFTLDAYARLLRSLTGRRLQHLMTVPRTATLVVGRLADMLRRRIGLRLPFSHEQVWMLYAWPPTEDRLAEEVAGPPPPVETTMGDAIRWMVDAGHLPAERAGAVAGRPA